MWGKHFSCRKYNSCRIFKKFLQDVNNPVQPLIIENQVFVLFSVNQNIPNLALHSVILIIVHLVAKIFSWKNYPATTICCWRLASWLIYRVIVNLRGAFVRGNTQLKSNQFTEVNMKIKLMHIKSSNVRSFEKTTLKMPCRTSLLINRQNIRCWDYQCYLKFYHRFN